MDICRAFVTIAVLIILASASSQDWRRREVDDIHWWAIMAIGSSSMCICSLLEGNLLCTISAVAASLLFCGMMRDNLPLTLSGIAVSIMLWSVAFMSGVSDPGTISVLAVPVFIILFYGTYAIGMLPGGADVKCLMSISIVVPAWGCYPPNQLFMRLVFPPSVSVMAVACVITVVSGIIWGVYKNRCLALSGVHCYRMPIAEARRAHVWILEDVVDGEIARTEGSEDIAPVCDRLEDHGADDVLVSPMYPFVIPLTAAFVLVMLSS